MEFYGFTFYAGDFVSLFSLFFDNLKTLLGLSGAILALSPTSTLLPEIVYQRVVPAAGIMLFLGSSYYSYQAVRMTKKYNKHYTAQPYGLNTAGGFPFVFGIIYGVYFSITPSCVGDAIEATGYDPIHRRRMTELSWRGGCWAYGLNTTVADPVSSGAWIGGAFYEGFSDICPYIGVVLPFSIAASFGDMMCLVSAQKYPIRETMIVDGLGTLIGAILGSPFGTVVYIGHPVHKRVGARTGYSVMNGFIYLILCLAGIIPVILSLIPAIAIGPIIMIFGLMICEECTKHIHQRHHAAISFGIFFGVCDYIYTNFAPGATVNGPNAMSKGSALASMFWVSIIVYTTDRKWIRAGIFCVITAFFAGAGLIHQDGAFENFTTGFQKTTNSSPLQFMIGYLSMGVVTAIYWLLQTKFPKKLKEGEDGYEDDHGYLPPIEDAPGDNLFLTWWNPVTDTMHADGSGKSGKTLDDMSLEKDVEDVEEVYIQVRLIIISEDTYNIC